MYSIYSIYSYFYKQITMIKITELYFYLSHCILFRCTCLFSLLYTVYRICTRCNGTFS